MTKIKLCSNCISFDWSDSESNYVISEYLLLINKFEFCVNQSRSPAYKKKNESGNNNIYKKLCDLPMSGR